MLKKRATQGKARKNGALVRRRGAYPQTYPQFRWIVRVANTWLNCRTNQLRVAALVRALVLALVRALVRPAPEVIICCYFSSPTGLAPT